MSGGRDGWASRPPSVLTGSAGIAVQRGLAAGFQHRLQAYERVFRGLELASAALILMIGVGAVAALLS